LNSIPTYTPHLLFDKTQTCQVILISRVRPAFWPLNQHSLAEISTNGVTSILEFFIPHTLN